MSGVNYFGGGVANVERSVDHYKIIDERKSGAAEARSVDTQNNFNKVLEKTKAQLDGKVNFGKKAAAVNNRSLVTNREDGTNIALKKMAKQFVNQFYGMYWSQIAETIKRGEEENFGVKIFQKSLLPKMLESGQLEELDELEKEILRELIIENIQKKIDVRK